MPNRMRSSDVSISTDNFPDRFAKRASQKKKRRLPRIKLYIQCRNLPRRIITLVTVSIYTRTRHIITNNKRRKSRVYFNRHKTSSAASRQLASPALNVVTDITHRRMPMRAASPPRAYRAAVPLHPGTRYARDRKREIHTEGGSRPV